MECAGVFLISTEGGAFRPFEIRLAAGISSRAAAFLGQRHHRVRHVSRQHRRHDGGGHLCRALSRARGDCRAFCCWVARSSDWSTSLGISRVPAADPAKKFRWNPLGDFCDANEDDSRRPRARLGRARQHVSLVSRGAAAIHDRDLWARCAARRRRAHQLFASGRRRSASESAALRRDIFPAEKSSTG